MTRPRTLLGLLSLLLPIGCGAEDETPASSGVRVLGGRGTDAGQFVTPRGVGVGGGLVWVVDKSGRLQVLRTDGAPHRSARILETTVGFPLGVLPDPDGAWVCDTHNSRLRRFDLELAEGVTIGGLGTQPGSFTYPQRIARDTAGNLYISEYGDGEANRVQVFDAEGRYLRGFGGYGDRNGKFTRALGITVVHDEVFVTDVSDRVVVYGTGGDFRREFGDSGARPGELDYPYGICAVGSTLYVCEYGNHRLQRFDLDGRPRGTFGGFGSAPGQFRGPWDVAADERGILYVADTGNHRIVVVDPAVVRWDEGDEP